MYKLSKVQTSTNIYKWSAISCEETKFYPIFYSLIVIFSSHCPAILCWKPSEISPTQGRRGWHPPETFRSVDLWFIDTRVGLPPTEKSTRCVSLARKYAGKLKKNSEASLYLPSAQGRLSLGRWGWVPLKRFLLITYIFSHNSILLLFFINVFLMKKSNFIIKSPQLATQ